mmetsp:Transcript_11350/g.47580  ORF Transcript_11350/g.47580 Transcript_11350/m.47580 type:complete len:318 (-) Transcript_11350:1288-2241(-)
MHRVATMRSSVLKYASSGRVAASSESARALLDVTSIFTPAAAQLLSSGSNMRGAGAGCLRSIACEGNALRIASALATFARSIISSTIRFASRVTYMPTSRGSEVVLSSSNFTSGDARLRAPAATRLLRSALAQKLMFRRSFARSLTSSGSSIIACASWYVNAASLLMTAFVNRGCASGTGRPVVASNLKNTENVKRSVPPLNEHMSSVSGFGSISSLLFTKYVVVPRRLASSSIAVFGLRNEVTSAMCTPSSNVFGAFESPSSVSMTRHESASSMSRQPGGSTEHTRRERWSSRRNFGIGPRCSLSSNRQGKGGTHA